MWLSTHGQETESGLGPLGPRSAVEGAASVPWKAVGNTQGANSSSTGEATTAGGQTATWAPQPPAFMGPGAQG